ncbi:MAG TPA: hypothetical protein VGM90_35625 [Kofleriaceae bacterium]|jgi:hypothetical protein
MVEAAEVVVKLGDSIVSITRVERGSAYWVGTAPGVDLAVRIGVTRWPLVESTARGFVVRDPQATGHDQTLAANDAICISLGMAVAHVMPIIGAVPQLPLRRAELRPWIYGLFALALHLTVWLCAELSWRPEKLVATKPPPRLMHIAHAPPEEPKPRPAIEQKHTAEKTAAASTTKGGGKRGAGSGAAAGSGGDESGFGSWGNIGALIPTVDVVGMVNDSVAYDEEGAKANQFGNHAGYKPCEHFDCSSVKLEHYTVQMTEEGAGANYDVPGAKAVPPRVAVTTPSVTGSVKSTEIQKAVANRDAALQNCLTQFSSQTKGSLRIDILIDRSGGVGINGLKGHNDQQAKDCVADVVRGVVFDGSYADETTASVQIAFAFTK